MPALAVTAWTMTSALGRGRPAHRAAVADHRSGLRPNDFSLAPLPCHIGRVDGVEDIALPDPQPAWRTRNNRLAWLGLEQDGFTTAVEAARQRFGAGRVAVLLGTSTGSIGSTEEAYRRLENGHFADEFTHPVTHSLHSLGEFVAATLQLDGPALTFSTACSSGAKAFAAAERMLRLGIVDAALVGGVDSLCQSVLFGFNSLQLVSDEACRPFDVARKGISIGEAAAFMLLQRDKPGHDGPLFVGYGESSDAWHMSTPHPEGLGAELAMRAALHRAGIAAADVDYINLHGTATPKNDEVEAAVVARLFPETTRISSTKGATGHTLGTAGALEAGITLLALEHGCIPGNVGCVEPDPTCAPQLALRPEKQVAEIALSNSFGFGGNNACLAFARGTEANA